MRLVNALTALETTVIWEHSSRPVAHFQGRTEIIEQISQYFNSEITPGYNHKILLLYGLGGLGKSQTALAYAESARETHYTDCLYINATTKQTLLASFSNVADMIDHHSANPMRARVGASDNDGAVNAVKFWL